MLSSIKFVQGSIASKGFAPELTHFCIKDGMIRGFNGDLALASPIDLDLNVIPKAKQFIKAIIACKAETAMHITGAGRLCIKSGKFKAFIDCIEETYPNIEPEGDKIALKGSFIKQLALLKPFIAEDASKPWARGILLDGCTATATNNIVIVQKWIDEPFPIRVNIPETAVRELVRIKEEPTHMSVTENTISFYYANGRWLRSNLVGLDWPDINRVLDAESNPKPVPVGLFDAIQDLKDFVEESGRLIFADGKVMTTRDEGEGASVELDGLPQECCINWRHLAKLEGIAVEIDLAMYPAPCIFYGDNLRGAIVGMVEL